MSNYIAEALSQAVYDRRETGGAFIGRIPACPGVDAVGRSLLECEDELRLSLERWITLGLRSGRRLPVLNGIDLNGEPPPDLPDTA